MVMTETWFLPGAACAAGLAASPRESGRPGTSGWGGSVWRSTTGATGAISAGGGDIQPAGGVEHAPPLPMEAGFDPSPRLPYRHSPATMNMGLTAENLALR